MLRNKLIVPAAVAACLVSSSLWAAESEGSVPAVWADKELNFVYQGFTTKYSCDGLRDKMRGVLLDLGADKKTLKVMDYGCSRLSGPDPFPGVRAKLRIVQPAATRTDAKQTPVSAHWKPLDLKLPDSYTIDSGECELIEQIKDRVLPLFATRNVDLRSNCIPHQASVGRPVLKLEVLVPDDVRHPAGEQPANQ